MALSAKDHVDLITKCDERLRQNWIGLVTLTYGIPILLASRDQLCRVGIKGSNAGDPVDPKEWILIIYPVFAAFFIYGLWQNFLERRSWLESALGTQQAYEEIPARLQTQWSRALTPEGRVVRDLWLAFRIVVVLLSGGYGIFQICSIFPRQGWFAGTGDFFNSIWRLDWINWKALGVFAGIVLIVACLLLLISRIGRWEGSKPATAGASLPHRLLLECQHGWQLVCRSVRHP